MLILHLDFFNGVRHALHISPPKLNVNHFVQFIFAKHLSLVDARIEYPNGADSVFYIGSAGNIGKRLKEHLKPYNKNGGIREYLGKYDCFFKYIVLEAGWQKEEKKLYDLFAVDFGAPPRCNMASPQGGGKAQS
jgi:hypothetical protein